MSQINRTAALSLFPDLIKSIEEIKSARSVGEACATLGAFFKSLDAELLSIKFYDREDDTRYLKPFNVYPKAVHELLAELMTKGGCPFSLEAKKLMKPFAVSEIDQSKYSSFTERRFFKEISVIGHKQIAVLPVMIGRGIALATVGLHDQPFAGVIRMRICDSIPHIIAAFISKFPEISNFFEEKNLTCKEINILEMMCEGRSRIHITDSLGVSEQTVNLFIKNAMRKTNAETISQLIYRAIVLGEISPHRS